MKKTNGLNETHTEFDEMNTLMGRLLCIKLKVYKIRRRSMFFL